MDKNIITRIIRKYLSGRFSSDTEERVQKWIIKDKNIEEKEKASLEYWNELEAKTDPDTELVLDRVNQRIGYKEIVHRPFYQKLARIAAVLIPLFMMTGGYLYYTSTQNKWIEISVAYGDKKHFLLPDSSEIWLNAGTVVKYPKEFSKVQRLVHLDGEAYFSIRKDTSKPFIVETSQLSVKVLGTKFNVKAYADDELVTTTLTSGKVEVIPPTQDPQILKPNEQLTYDKKTSAVNITEVSPTDTDGWITGKLIFSDAPFTEILQTLERRYNVTINHTMNIPASKQYTVRFLKNENLEEILSVLSEMIGFSYQKQGNKVELIKKQ
ncbi:MULTISPECIES: FecR family protein [Bacteroides]|jgi:transmembrane sensor|uniref:FecR family protein n=1 Tax=Bacteroides TaxID=816 RepID=UPI000E46EE4E|nr:MULTISPECIES: FecR family protein [Bacteroides]RHL06668.1 DUF4974 domain-containing protein [Bacteroides sp. AF39-11AC]